MPASRNSDQGSAGEAAQQGIKEDALPSAIEGRQRTVRAWCPPKVLGLKDACTAFSGDGKARSWFTAAPSRWAAWSRGGLKS
jgi:hypothetical protein